MLKIEVSHSMSMTRRDTEKSAAMRGCIETLENIYPLESSTYDVCKWAIKANKLAVVKWCMEDSEFEFIASQLCELAAVYGRLQILEVLYLVDPNPFTEKNIVIIAAGNNHDHILDWAYFNGWVINMSDVITIAINNHSKTVMSRFSADDIDKLYVPPLKHWKKSSINKVRQLGLFVIPSPVIEQIATCIMKGHSNIQCILISSIKHRNVITAGLFSMIDGKKFSSYVSVHDPERFIYDLKNYHHQMIDLSKPIWTVTKAPKIHDISFMKSRTEYKITNKSKFEKRVLKALRQVYLSYL